MLMPKNDPPSIKSKKKAYAANQVAQEPLTSVLIIPMEEWNSLKEAISYISSWIDVLKESKGSEMSIKSPYITAKEFMAAVRICRSNFDKLVQARKIMTLKKGRKVYVVASEVERYFKEVEV